MLTQQLLQIRAAHLAIVAATIGIFVACGRAPAARTDTTATTADTGSVYVVRDTTIETAFIAAGVAAPLQQATLSTKLMGTVGEVLVREGERVAAGQVLVRIDARDLSAKSAQASASIADAEALRADANTQATRIRALYADSAATQAQLDAVETGLARAEAHVRAAHAAAVELEAVSSYAVIRAPFGGIVTKRFVDPGAFAAPGAPLVTVQDASQLRITASATPDIARTLRRGQRIPATIEGRPVRATIEGVVPVPAGNLYAINAIVPNADAAILAGSTATVALPMGARQALVVPATAITREGELTGVTLRAAHGDVRRWVRLGRASGDIIEVSAGLRAGDRVVLPASRVAATAGN